MAKKDLSNLTKNMFSEAQTVEPTVNAPKETIENSGLSPEKEEELQNALHKKRSIGKGRPKKWEDGKRADGYSRTSIIVNTNKWEVVKEIAFRETLTTKELIEAALDIIIDGYEKKHGKVTPTNHDRDVKSLLL